MQELGFAIPWTPGILNICQGMREVQESHLDNTCHYMGIEECPKNMDNNLFFWNTSIIFYLSWRTTKQEFLGIEWQAITTGKHVGIVYQTVSGKWIHYTLELK